MQKRIIDFSTIVGIGLALTMVFTAISLDGSLSNFLNLPAFLIVIIGTLLVTSACFSFDDLFMSLRIIFKMIFFKTHDLTNIVHKMLSLSEVARRKNSLFEIEHLVNTPQYDSFLKHGIKLIGDGNNIELVEMIINQQISSNINRYNKVVLMMRKAAETSPAMGLIGTLIGLVQMLSSLSDPTKLGPSMAIALLTTFYGALLSYIVFFPLASKLERNAKEEMLIEKIYLKTIVSIAHKENPRHLENVINSLLSPAQKVRYFG